MIPSLNEPLEPTFVSVLTVADETPDDTHTFQLIAGTGDIDNNRFVIRNGALWLRETEILDFETQSSYNVRLLVTDAIGNSLEQTLQIDVNDLTAVKSVELGDPDSPWSGQRSTIVQVEIVIDGVVEIDPDAIQIERAGTVNEVVTTHVTQTTVGTDTLAIITFSGPLTRGETGALIDGNYRLSIDSARIYPQGSTAPMMADFVYGGHRFDEHNNDDFFSLFGDANGDGVRNNTDLATAVGALLNPSNYRSDLDYDRDGRIDAIDLMALNDTMYGPRRD